MGIWSVYIHSPTPSVTIDFSKLPTETLEFLHNKTNLAQIPDRMTVDALGREFSDCARIWGYVSNEMYGQLRGMLNGLSSTAEMVFVCDDCMVKYYTIRFDKLRNDVDFFVLVDHTFDEMSTDDFIERIAHDKIPWVLYQEKPPHFL